MRYLEEVARAIDKLRKEILCSEAGEGLDPFSEQHFLAALDTLGLAQRHMELATYHERRELAGRSDPNYNWGGRR